MAGAVADALMEAGMDGKKVPVREASDWRASLPTQETHFQVCSGFLVPAQMSYSPVLNGVIMMS